MAAVVVKVEGGRSLVVDDGKGRFSSEETELQGIKYVDILADFINLFFRECNVHENVSKRERCAWLSKCEVNASKRLYLLLQFKY